MSMNIKKCAFLLLTTSFISSHLLAQTAQISPGSIADTLSGPVQDASPSLTRGFKPRANPDAATKVCDPNLNVALLEKTGTKGEALTRTLYVEAVPKIDLDISFKKGEATLLPAGEKQLDSLAIALKDSRLAGQSFVVAGHTDAEGGVDYNDRLSCERALSARKYLHDKYGINDNSLIPMGFGFSKLKNSDDKFSEVNRRVEIRKYVPNMAN